MLHRKRRIRPAPLEKGSPDVVALIENYFNAYNAARLREACQTFARMIDEGATIGVSISGALTPAGLSSVLVPLIQKGFIDYVSSTGANLYHDLHFDLDLALYRGSPDVATGAHDVALRKGGIIRVYDVLFEADVLFKTDEWVYRVLQSPEFAKELSGSELHHKLGKYALETARKAGVTKPSILAVCHENDVPVWVASPGDSTIGLNLSAIHTAFPEKAPKVDPAADVMEMSALVLDAKRKEGRPVGRDDLRRRRAQELPAADRAAAAGDPGRGGEGARLLHPDHRRAPRHRRSIGGHPVRGSLVGEDRSREAAGHGGLLPRFDGGASPDGLVRAGQVQAAQAQAALRPTPPDGRVPAHRVPQDCPLRPLLGQARRAGEEALQGTG
jgi:deoxyhypusine synthase